MSSKTASDRSQGRNLLLLLGAAVMVVMLLLAYQLWLSYQEVLDNARVVTRNYAAILETRLDATLRRIEADLDEVAKEVPLAALQPQAVLRHAESLDALLDTRLANFKEVIGYRVTNARGDTLYTSSSTSTPRVNVADRGYFRELRDNPKLGLVFSEVVTGRSTGVQVMAVARALRDGEGRFLGVTYAILSLEHIQQTFRSLELGPGGVISLLRNDNNALVVRWPHLPQEVNKSTNPPGEITNAIAAGERRLTMEITARFDGVRRVFSIHVLQHYPFRFAVGISRTDVLAGWYQRALVVAISALLLLVLLSALMFRLWQMRDRESKILEELATREELFRQMAEGIDQVFFKATKDYSRFDYISPAFDRVWGRDRELLLASPGTWGQWIHDDDRDRVQAFIAANVDADDYSSEFRIVRGDGAIRWILAHAFRLKNPREGGRVVGFQADVTERKQAEAIIVRERDFVREALDSLPGLFYLIEEGGRFLRWNHNFETVSGYSADEIRRMSPLDFFGDEDKGEVAAAISRVFAGGEASVDAKFVSKNGSRTPFLFNGKRTVIEGKLCLMGMGIDISSRKQTEQALQESESYNKILFDGSHIPLAVLDPETFRLIDCNQAAIDIYGYDSREALLAISPGDVATPLQYDGRSSAETAIEHIEPALRDGLHVFEWRHRRPNGQIWDAEVRLMRFQYRDRTLLQFSLQDISERKRAEADLRIAATAFESQEGMIITDADQRILRINRACLEITGYTAEEVLGNKPGIFGSGRHDKEFFQTMWASISEHGFWKGEIINRRKNGDIYPCWANISAVKGEGGRVSHYVASIMDISQRKTAEDEIKHLAFYDPLTKLPNRRLLLDRLRHALLAGARSESAGALLFIDLDNFKTLNDTLGHDKGDLLLESVARRLAAAVREQDTVARLGGDEFVVMLEGLSLNLEDAAAQTRLVGEKILKVMDQAHDLAGMSHRSTASIGIALFTHQTDTVDELLKRADLAMYQAKAEGRNTLRFFDPRMQSVVMSRVALEADLRVGIERAQLLLHFQPQVDERGMAVGAEALVRWQHPERGMIPPLEFIPLAEDTGLILPLGKWVLETACAQLSLWASDPQKSGWTLSVNVSARQFRQADFVDQVLTALKQCGAAPRQLKLELTESLLLDDVEGIVAKMTALKEQGVGFSLDDFGTGYSSLSYLKRLPLDQLKIDQSFVRDVLTDPNDAAIARTIVALGQSMGLTVIAEGVETGEQRDFLWANGCRFYQGYLFGRPMPAGEFDRLMSPS